ncbi:MAG: dTDP-4-dehydrorhamnose reductase [Bacteroidetes bacterium]|nr:dTDP-4-dehydrorhamnose reductase [Bacteroidota bacterium]
MPARHILITGSTGQLGNSLKQIEHLFPGYEFVYTSRENFPLDNAEKMQDIFASVQPDYCINCAAYTAVDKAELEKELAFKINAEAVGNIAKLSHIYHCHLIHISTDYVFNGNSDIAYTEEDLTSPVNVYGASKAEGEKLALIHHPDTIIIRTSWVFSESGKNFVKTMISLMHSREEINVVNDQQGSPTYAPDLAAAIMKIISSDCWLPGIYHFCNSGKTTWFEFANAIKEMISTHCRINPIPSSAYPTPALRPKNSLLNTTKVRNSYNLQIRDWKIALQECIIKLQTG